MAASPSSDATGRLAEYITGLRADDLPPSVVDRARVVLADTIGVLFAASRHRAVRTALEAFPRAGGPCTVVGHGRGASPETAALINGIGGHDIELDDGGHGIGHAASVVIPAALAAAEVGGRSTLGSLLAGIIAGYDVQGRVAQAMGGTVVLHARGFHPSGVCGAIGAAAAAGRVLGLDTGQLRSCIGLAANQSSGLLAYKDEPTHMAKSFQTGVAARNGVTAALLARHGYQGAPDVLTGRHDVLRPFAGDAAEPERLVDELGSRHEICLMSLKRHASCIQTHAAVDVLLDLMAANDVVPDEIDRVDVEVAHKAVPRIDRNILWTHNLQYVMAVAAVAGRVAPEHGVEPWTSDPRVVRLTAAVTLAGNDELEARFPARQGTVVTLHTRRGAYSGSAVAPRGSPDLPLADDELRDKFAHLAGQAIPPDRVARLWEGLRAGPLSADLGEVFETLGLGR